MITVKYQKKYITINNQYVINLDDVDGNNKYMYYFSIGVSKVQQASVFEAVNNFTKGNIISFGSKTELGISDRLHILYDMLHDLNDQKTFDGLLINSDISNTSFLKALQRAIKKFKKRYVS